MLHRICFSDDDEPEPTYVFPDRPAGWDFLRHILDVIYSLFGDPATLTKLGGVSKGFRDEMNDWLRAAERLARILLLAEAAELKLPKMRPRVLLSKRRPGRFPRQDLRSAKSEEWRVRFTLLRGSNKSGSGAKGYSIPCIRPERLAARFEALARVALNPSPYARRLALALRRRADRRRQIAIILRRPATDAGPFLHPCAWALPLVTIPPLAFDSG